jgi:mediator of RNA polymerase II transcription subunit 6
MSEDSQKRGISEAESTGADSTADPSMPQEKRTEVPKRQQNNMLLMNAMRTTAIHSKMSFSASSSQNIETIVPDTPTTTPMRSSATPAPPSQEVLSKGLTTALPQEPNRGPVGGGKKKKKRLSRYNSKFINSLTNVLGTSLAAPAAPN